MEKYCCYQKSNGKIVILLNRFFAVAQNGQYAIVLCHSELQAKYLEYKYCSKYKIVFNIVICFIQFRKIARLILLSFLKTYSASSVPPQSSKSKFSLSSTIKPQSITVHYFSFIATATRYRSDNQIAIHSREIIHIRFEGLYIGK